MSDISCTVVGVGKYEPEHKAVPVVERPHKKESSRQMMRPCLKHNKMQKQEENICLIREVTEGIQELQTSELSFKMSRSLPRRQEGKNIQGKGPVHAKHKGKKKRT